MQCGQPVAGAVAAKRSMPQGWIIAIICLLATLAALGGLAASGYFRAIGQGRDGTALQAEGAQPGNQSLIAEGSQSNNNVLRAEREGTPPTLPANGERVVMPDDVRNWLEHLERTERRREELSTEQLTSAMTMMTTLQLGTTLSNIEALLNGEESGEEPRSPAQTVRADIGAMESAWKTLDREFQSVPPPAECIPIKASYDQTLGETGAMIVHIVDQVSRADEDRDGALNALMKMRGTSSERIGKPARNTDDMVYQICRKYNTRKWFAIRSDFGSGILSKIGF
jgi:hypothetical protein